MTSSNPPIASAHAPAKKQRRDDDKQPLGDPKGPGQISLTRRRVWRACESCRRKKIKCDGVEPICGQCTQSVSNCTWIQTRDRAALSRQYVQELENRVIRLEAVLAQVAPHVNLTNLPTGPIPLPEGQAQAQAPPAVVNGGASSVTSRPSRSGAIPGLPPIRRSRSVERNDDDFVAEHMGALALDDHGHLSIPVSLASFDHPPRLCRAIHPGIDAICELHVYRWIGGSSTMSLIEAFRNFSATEDRADAASSPPSTTGPHSTPTPNPPSTNLLYFPSSLRFGKVRALPGPDEVEYPPWDLADKLVNAYFERFHHTLPVLDSRSFMTKYKRLVEARKQAEERGEASSLGTSKSEAAFVSVVFAVYAIAARFVDDDRLKLDEKAEEGEETGGMGMVYYERAMILYYIGASATQLAHVQAFVLLSSFLASLNCLPQAWLLCGQAVRIAQDLGLHRSPKNLTMSPINKETRRKIWWCVYGLDRMLAMALGRPLGTEDSDCDVEMPIPIDDIDLVDYFAKLEAEGNSPSSSREILPEKAHNSLMAGFNALTELYVIVGRVLRTVYAVDAVEVCKTSVEITQKQVEALDKELTEWCDKLPSTFKSDPKSPQQISLGAILCSSYYSALITLHRNFLPTKRKGAPNPNWASVPKAVFASRSCILLSLTTKDAIPRSHHLAFFVQALFSAAVIILLCARFATVESAARTASEEVNTALVCLGALEAAWPGSKKCKELLQELVEATRNDMKVQVPGVGRPGSVNGLVAPTPAGVDKVQTVYHSYKRAANEGGQEGQVSSGGESDKGTRKIKARPRASISGKLSDTSSPPKAESTSGQTDVEMDYIQDPHENNFQPFAPVALNGYNGPNGNAPSIMKLAETPSNPPPSAFGMAPNTYAGVPHDWLPSPTADNFNMSSFTNENLFASLPSASQPHSPSSPTSSYPFKGYDLSPMASTNNAGAPAGNSNFDFSSAEIPFSGFDFLQLSGNMGGFGANDVAAWTNFVGTGVFNNVPDQPFSISEGVGSEAAPIRDAATTD